MALREVGSFSIAVYGLADDRLRVLAEDGIGGDAHWAPSNQSVTYTGGVDRAGGFDFVLRSVDLATGTTQVLAAGHALFSESPWWGESLVLVDGQRNVRFDPRDVSYTRYNWIVQAPDGQRTPFLRDRWVEQVLASPGGKATLARCAPNNDPRYWDRELVLVEDPHDPTGRVVMKGRALDAVWSRQGDRVLVGTWYPGPPSDLLDPWDVPQPGLPPVPEPRLSVLDVETGAQEVLVDASGAPIPSAEGFWAHDDTEVLYLKRNGQLVESIWSYDLATKSTEQVYPFR